MKKYLVGATYKDGSAENEYVIGFSNACDAAEKLSSDPCVESTSIWLGYTPIREYGNGSVIKEHNGVSAY